jgi:hypothetical protein
MDIPTPAVQRSIPAEERDKLYRMVRMAFGWPMRPLEFLTDQAMELAYEQAQEDYFSYVSEWLISQQWDNLQGAEVDKVNFVRALSTRSLDYVTQFATAYGKQTGISSRGEWELKKDYVDVVAGQQIYEIPAGREINEVLWHTPPLVTSAQGVAGSTAWLASAQGWSWNGLSASAVLPSYTTLLYAQDRLMRNRINLSESSYKITAGPDGTRLLHLYPVPGDTKEIPGSQGRTQTGDKVWYWYYDTNEAGRELCQEINSDVIRTPDQVPSQLLSWSQLNVTARTRIRKFMIAAIGRMVASGLGFYKGEIPSPNSSGKTISIDYALLGKVGTDSYQEVTKELLEALEKMSPLMVLKRKAEEAEAINRTIRFQPPKRPFILG